MLSIASPLFTGRRMPSSSSSAASHISSIAGRDDTVERAPHRPDTPVGYQAGKDLIHSNGCAEQLSQTGRWDRYCGRSIERNLILLLA